MIARTLPCDTLSNSTEVGSPSQFDIMCIMGRFEAAGYTETEGRRFAAKLRRSPAGCLEWTGARNSKGYGCLVLRTEPWLAHRLAHVVFIGPIPEGFEVDHVRARGCTSILCMEPDHLEAVSKRENVLRAVPYRPSQRGPYRRQTAVSA